MFNIFKRLKVLEEKVARLENERDMENNRIRFRDLKRKLEKKWFTVRKDFTDFFWCKMFIWYILQSDLWPIFTIRLPNLDELSEFENRVIWVHNR